MKRLFQPENDDHVANAAFLDADRNDPRGVVVLLLHAGIVGEFGHFGQRLQNSSQLLLCGFGVWSLRFSGTGFKARMSLQEGSTITHFGASWRGSDPPRYLKPLHRTVASLRDRSDSGHAQRE